MFNFKSFLSITFLSLVVVLFLHANTAHSAEKDPVVASVTQVNINTADAETIASTLKGIGLKKAQAIVEYRENFGPFHDVEELLEVKGIGKSTLEKNVNKMLVE